ncbi:MAG: type II toxin-antitoxin system RelE/ParE family toxin [Desulfoplanes sp.]|nr:type II toxin-antitoxin system RelE/ParE family toxin [Desulfoplanes sp.]
MTWSVIYHHGVEEDLEGIGKSMARRVLKAIEKKLTKAPLAYGMPLSGNLADFRKLRVGDCRVVYQVIGTEVVVYVLAVGFRRNKDVYKIAGKRE